MDKKIMKLLGVCLFAVASVGVLTACSDNDAENPEGGKPGGEDVNPAPEVVEFVNSNLVYWGDKDGVGTDHFVLTLYTDMECKFWQLHSLLMQGRISLLQHVPLYHLSADGCGRQGL